MKGRKNREQDAPLAEKSDFQQCFGSRFIGSGSKSSNLG
jgi:hypothetical protein